MSPSQMLLFHIALASQPLQVVENYPSVKCETRSSGNFLRVIEIENPSEDQAKFDKRSCKGAVHQQRIMGWC